MRHQLMERIMAYGAYARFLDPKDEPSFEGVTVCDVEIDSIEIAKGQWLPIRLLADFAWDDTGWMCTALFIQTEARTKVPAIDDKGVAYTKEIITEDYINAIGRGEWGGLVGMVEGWANENLNPTDYL